MLLSIHRAKLRNASGNALSHTEFLLSSFALIALAFLPAVASAQQITTEPDDTAAPEVKDTVEVDPTADDAEIAARLTRILEATGWFEDVDVRVDEGIVFLAGRTDSDEHRQWAGRLASNTEGVVAPVNQIQVAERSMWDLTPAWGQMRELGQELVQNTPLFLLGLVLLFVAWVVATWAMRGSSRLLTGRIRNELLRNVAAKAVALLVLTLGIYLVLRVSGLTRLALTVLGGTGLVGLVIGIGFRDIAENFLASILISMHRPFHTGDLVQVNEHQGYVQQVNSRSTLLMTLDGNHVQIPNATIYKSTITNYNSNPHMRCSFTVGIGYENSIAKAQSVGLEVMEAHPAVLDSPEPLVLVEALGAATVNLRCYFWLDVTTHSWLKTESAVLRLVKKAFQQADISMPDEAREVVFPEGVPVFSVEAAPQPAGEREPQVTAEDDDTAHSAEGDLASESADIEQQARQARLPEEGRNLLEE